MNPYLRHFQNPVQHGRLVRRARVEIIPLIDVMFLLVAFFMVVSISMVAQKGIFVDLAPAITGDSSLEGDDEALVISVDAGGAFYLNKELIIEGELSSILSERAQKTPDIAVILNADKQAAHAKVIAALDLVRQSGLHNVIFAVEPRD